MTILLNKIIEKQKGRDQDTLKSKGNTCNLDSLVIVQAKPLKTLEMTSYKFTHLV